MSFSVSSSHDDDDDDDGGNNKVAKRRAHPYQAINVTGKLGFLWQTITQGQLDLANDT